MTTKTFDSLGLKPKTLRAVKKLNYTAPMPVQAEVIPLILNGRDVLATARTGSGKTAAFTIPLLDILARSEEGSALVIAPTRELAQQIYTVFNQLADGAGIQSALITGGKFMQNQLRKLKNNPRFIAGTPGRLNDHITRKSLVLDNFKHIVWDEMDRMLELGFIHQIEHIVSKLPAEKQTLMFSATLPKRVEGLARKYLQNPVRVTIDDINSASKNVRQQVIYTETAKKPRELEALLKNLSGQIIIFTKTQKSADLAARQIRQNNHAAQALHGGMRQRERDKTVAAFRAGEFGILVATDVAARGLDIPGVSHVINYELPQAPHEYIHRIGRTGRVNAAGAAISLIGKDERAKWKEIQEFLKGNEAEVTESERQREKIILQANAEAGPFPARGAFPAHGALSARRENNYAEGGQKNTEKSLQPSRQPAGKHKKYGRRHAVHWGKLFAKKAKRSHRLLKKFGR